MLGAGGEVDAGAAARCLPVRAYAAAGDTRGSTAAGVSASSAVERARLQIDAGPRAQRLAAGAGACAGNAGCRARTRDRACPAVAGVRRQIHAGPVALRRARSAVGRARAGRANLLAAASRVALAAVGRTAQEVHADALTGGLSGGAGAAASDAGHAARAGDAAAATMARVGLRIDAHTIAFDEVAAAVGLAGAGVAHLIAATDVVAGAAVLPVGQGIDAATRAEQTIRRADALPGMAEGAALTCGAAGAAVLIVRAQIETTAEALHGPCSAVIGTGPG
jgi:hypothetical protein